MKIADDWTQTADLWRRKRPLYQLCPQNQKWNVHKSLNGSALKFVVNFFFVHLKILQKFYKLKFRLSSSSSSSNRISQNLICEIFEIFSPLEVLQKPKMKIT